MKPYVSVMVGVLILSVMLAVSSLAQNSPQFYLTNESNVTLPGQRVIVRFPDYNNDLNAAVIPEATVRLYRIPLAARLQWVREQRYAFSLKDLASLDLVRQVQVHGSRAKDEPQRIDYLQDFGTLPVGQYLVRRDDAQAELIEVGDAGTVWHVGGGALLVYSVDLRTFRTRSDMRYTLYGRDGSRRGLVVFNGLAWLHGVSQSAVLVGQAPNGSVTVQSLYGSPAQSRPIFVQTDRPVYRAGQQVFIRGAAREGSIGNYVVPHGSLQLIITGPDGSTLQRKKVPLSAFGTFFDEVALPQSAQLGSYTIRVDKSYASFSVEAYKKPEYFLAATPQSKVVVGGETARFALAAKYFFGRPAAGMHVHYSAQISPWYFPMFNPYGFLGTRYPISRGNSAPIEGDAQTDASGNLAIGVPTQHVDAEEQLQLTVDARDDSGRTVSTQTQMRVVPASFAISAEPSRWYTQVGQELSLSITTKGYDEKPRSGVPVEVKIGGGSWDYRTHHERTFTEQTAQVRTDASGRATYTWTPRDAGSYSIEFSAKDERRRITRTSLWFWVSSPNEAWWIPNEQITLIPNKAKYAPGEHPQLLLVTPQSDADAVVMVSSDKIDSARLIHVSAKPQTLQIDPPKDASAYRVTVEVPGSNGLQSAMTQIAVDPGPRSLRVMLTPDKATYGPGDVAHVRLSVRDRLGKPVRAALGLGVVDEALYAVQADRTQSQADVFYNQRGIYVASNASWYHVEMQRPMLKAIASVSADRYVPAHGSENGLPAGMPAPTPAPSANAPVRSTFADTAFWAPDIATDAAGNADVAFHWPDNLTTWRATAQAITMQTDVGSGSAMALVTKDFLVRLEMPRFLRRGDRSQFIGIANGKAGSAATFSLDAGDLTPGAQPQTVTLDANGSGDANWAAAPLTSLGLRDITLRGSDGSLHDAVRLPLPILAAGAAEHIRDAGEVHDRSTVSYTLPALYDPGSVRVTLSPSVVASLLQNVQLLDVYPYYCTEQTMSAALPAIFLDRVAHRTGISLPEDSLKTSDVVKKAIARLRELQHSDGAWGWWPADDGHPFMTAYALYGLAEFRKAGFAVPGDMLDRGVASLLSQLATANDDTLRFWGGVQPGSEWNTRAFMLYALAEAAPRRFDTAMLAKTLTHIKELNPYALSVLGLAEHERGNDDAARSILSQLNARETDDGDYTYWLGATWEYAWEDDPIETTAYALRLNAALDPHSPRIARVVNFLRAQQHGSWWYTTKDTAASVYAISETVPDDSPEFHPNEVVRVLLGDRELYTHAVKTALLDSQYSSLEIPAALLEHGGDLRFEVTGKGSLYWSTDWTRYAPPYARKVQDAQESMLSRLRARAPDFSITRKYDAPHWPWRIGDQVSVEVEVKSTRDVDYVAIEDPFPAAAEYQTMQGEGADNWSGLQFFDDRAVFFATKLYANYPLQLRYELRVTTAGSYRAAPPTAYAMYGPPVSSVGQPDLIEVKER